MDQDFPDVRKHYGASIFKCILGCAWYLISFKLDRHSSSSALVVDLNSISPLKNSSISSLLVAPATSKQDGIIPKHLNAKTEWDANLLSISDFKWSEN